MPKSPRRCERPATPRQGECRSSLTWADLARMRERLRNWIIQTSDLGFLPESDLVARAGRDSPYEIAARLSYLLWSTAHDLRRPGAIG